MANTKLARFIARASMIAGLGVGVIGVLIWSYGFGAHPMPWVLRVGVTKVVLIVAGAMIFSGALVLRSIKQWERRKQAGARAPLPDESIRELGAPSWNAEWRRREQEPQRITTPPDPHTP
jgi:hypothetical protein